MKKSLLVSLCLFTLFIFWTLVICRIDVQPIGPGDSCVGLSGINGLFHNLTGVHFGLYLITDWLGLVPIIVCLGFGTLGLIQLIRRKSIKKVDFSLLVLGGFYLATIGAYLFFEKVVINYRPVLIGGVLEPSYPSSTTMLTLCVMLTAALQLKHRISNNILRKIITGLILLFTAFMVIGRLLSGVHWFTDIVGGALLSAGLITMYHFICSLEIRSKTVLQ